jgi:ABC-type polysaccharide/polyol phosphate transport system ATPase subunit
VKSICATGMWLERGRVRLRGDIDEVAAAYEGAEELSTPG